MPDLKRTSQVHGDQDNWCIFESISRRYLDACDRASVFDAVRQRAELQLDELRARLPPLAPPLIAALRNLANFSSQAHIVATVCDIVGAFIKNPQLIRTKFLNFMMVGAAGTGKTTLAAAIAKAFARAGMFVDDKVTDAGRAEFVGEYEGQTVARTRAFLVANLDRGVVFVDEAYAITPWSDGKPEGYGSEAATAMVEFMTKYKGLYCIMTAGYELEMTRYFLPTNAGLTRRFPYRFVLADQTPDDLLYIFKATLLTEQGIAVAAGRQAHLESDDYFTPSAWRYLKDLARLSCDGEWEVVAEEVDTATRKTYRNVKRFVPTYPHMYTLFENQAGSMTNLAEEAVVLLFSRVSFAEATATQQRTGGIARAGIRTQDRDVMRRVILRRIANSALSRRADFHEELRQIEGLMDLS